MKFARTITLDESDSRIFGNVATAGEWAISGTFEFIAEEEEQIEGKRKQAFTNGWMGLTSFGRSTFGVTTILEEEYENIIKILANKFIKDYGAPNLQIALPVAKRNRIYEFNMRNIRIILYLWLVENLQQKEYVRNSDTFKLMMLN